MLSEGGGWNGEAAAGWPAVVVVGAVGAAGGAGAGVGAGGGRVAVRAGAAGAVRRAGRGLGASTVTCGTVTDGVAPVGGVSGAGCAGCGAGVSAGGVSGVVVAGGVSDGFAGVCDDAISAKQSSTSAELLSRSKRLLWIDITSPHAGRERSPSVPTDRRITAKTAPRGVSAQRSLARGRADTRSMSGDGRCARSEQGAL